MNADSITELEKCHFATLNEIMYPNSNHQRLLKPLGEALMGTLVMRVSGDTI